MNRLMFLALLACVVVACGDAPTNPSLDPVPQLGIEPEPFHEAINQLYAQVNHLENIEVRLDAVFDMPVLEMKPRGAIGMLGAMENELGVINERVSAALSVPPAGETPDAFQPPLDMVYNLASDINEKAGVEPEPFTPELVDAFWAVATAADAIVDTVEEWRAGAGGPI